MNIELAVKFLELWEKHFNNAELPITVYFSETENGVERAIPKKGWSCLICELVKVRNGQSLCYTEEALKCGGAKRYLGYASEMRENFEYFLSCGIPGEMEGERYKRTPEIVLETQKLLHILPSKNKFVIFKRWDKLEESDNPDVVIFFATPDVLSGLFTLANYDTVMPDAGVFTPFSAGCGSIIHYPYLEKDKDIPRAVIGMFDPSARPCVPNGTLSFAVAMNRFEKMITYMEESFLITDTWLEVKERIK
jgi:uncharacterized protein (DUF169 family)